jgi:hypothetical protein
VPFGAFASPRRAGSVQPEDASREQHDRGDHDGPEHALAAGDGQARAEPAAGDETARQDEGRGPYDLTGEEEDRQRDRRRR